MSIPSYNETEFNSRLIAESIQAAYDLHRDRHRNIWQAGERTITVRELRSYVDAVIADSLTDVSNPKPISVLRDAVFADLESICSKFPIVRKTLKRRSVADLNPGEFSKFEWLVEGLIPAEGTTMLVSDPKTGKSWLSLLLGACVASDERFLGRETKHGLAFYLDIEGNDRRTYRRFEAMGRERPRKLEVYYRDDVPTLSNGLLEMLQDAYDDADEKPVLIIIDMYELVADMGERWMNAYDIGNENMNRINRFAERNHLAVLCCHHTKKENPRGNNDVFQSFIGGQSIYGRAQAQLRLVRDRTDKTKRLLCGQGRDYEEDVSLVLRYDKHGAELVGDYDEIRRREYVESLKREPLYRLIVKEMQERDEWKVTSTELCDALEAGYGESIEPVGKSLFNELQKLEQVLRGAGISWRRDKRNHTFRKIKVDIP